MKRFLLVAAFAAAFVLAGTSMASAQLRYGVIGGATFSRMNGKLPDMIKGENMTQYHAGATLQIKLPLGFSVQPSLIYNVKGTRLGVAETPDTGADLNIGYLELPVSLQWGPDLLLFRPFLDVTPFVGYGVNNKIVNASGVMKNSWDASGINRWEYGLGLGIGLEIWKFQVIGRYNWNFGSLMDFASDLKTDGVSEAVTDAFKGANFGGFTLTAAILF